jgi:DHA2 family multidrug resistance protein
VTDATALPATTAAGAEQRASLSDWLAVTAGTLGTFMALIDIAIVNASLPVIQGEIGATPSEGTWVSTTYFAAEIVVIPLTAWLERMIGLRRLMMWSTALFTVFSIVCGLATDLGSMIFGRVGQGLAGGVLIPCALTIAARRLPPSQQSIGLALVAISGTIGPMGGPVLGGWLTESFSWHLIFFVNAPVCLFQAALMMIAMEKSPHDWSELRNADWLGVAGMIIGLGSAMTLIEEGHRENWFDSTFIQKLAVASFIGFLMVGIGQFTAQRPVVRLSLMRNFKVTSGVLLLTLFGMLMYGGIFIIPQFLVAIADYNALQAGRIMFISGATALPAAMLYPVLVKRLDMRAITAIGLLMLISANLVTASLTSQSVGDAFVLTQMLFGAGTSIAAMPMVQSVIAAVAIKDIAEVNSLTSVARNFGGSLGIAAIASFEDQRRDFHYWQLHSAISANSIEAQQQIADAGQMYGGGPDGLEMAYRALDGDVLIQALVMSFNDVYVALAVITICLMPLVMFLQPFDQGRAAGPAH